ncbi:DUF397 domain-containing protein [Kitasatospora brasiliensis]|uniref:DUF397 domain-containing protein n=1 Tax=Kitasatospora brasiliensis TaxID=3058040 RepID=UPI00292DDEBE|nr:DUF397 domain-containing protein [Kitasatospora sp. K002]
MIAVAEHWNGMPAGLIDAVWVKSSASSPNGQCVEIAPVQGEVAVRNSRNPGGPALLFTKPEWAAHLAGVKAGEYDHMVTD